MEFFKSNTKIQFMRQRFIAAIISIVLFVASIAALAVNGLNLGLDFTGGTQIEMTFKQAAPVQQIRNKLENNGFEEAVVQTYTVHDVSIRIGPHKKLSQAQLKSQIQKLIPNGTVTMINFIGPQVGKSLMTNGILALLVALLGTMIYIALRFDYRFAISAAVALIHDPVLILGIFAFFHLEFNLIVLAAVLTVLGYSLNDTVVVYDRIRENFRKVRKGNAKEIVDLSINQTLSRTIMTSGLTLLVVIALYVWGGQTVHNFALALLIGIIIGTYSSIYVAGSLGVALGMNRSSLLPQKKFDDGLP